LPTVVITHVRNNARLVPVASTVPGTPNVALSVLDLAPVPAGSTAAQALANSVDLAQHAERLGYHRHWVAEHHNMAGIASSSPAVLIAHLANATTTLRVGSGGVMLPNHAALTVAEQFGTLEALHPGRIDLGLGRAPGTDAITAAALRRNTHDGGDEFPEQLGDLLAYFAGTHPRITAPAARGYRPALWLLGSSDYSAHAAGVLGLPFSFAHHFASAQTGQALDTYRTAFRPSQFLERPYAMIGVPVICAPDDDEATFLAGPSAFSFVRLRQGKPTQMPSPDDAAAYDFTAMEREIARHWHGPLVKGGPASVVTQLDDLVTRYRVDELMLTTMVYSHADRLRSYELVAESWNARPPSDEDPNYPLGGRTLAESASK
jgi:luciferase family oxidoreductase group 1